MIEIGTAILKNQLSAYLQKVKKGARILVTDHGKPVAKIVPLDDSGLKEDVEEILAKLASQGLIELGQPKKKFSQFKPIKLPGKKTALEYLIEDREES